MFKKLAATGAAAALLLATSVPAFAWYEGPKAFVNISNSGTVSNSVNTSSNTGYNGLTAWGEDGGVTNSSLTSGNALSSANVQTQLNWNQSTGSLSLSGVHFLDFDLSNSGTVSNNVNTSSNTGYNGITGHFGASIYQSPVHTGSATSYSVVSNVVNTNMFNVPTP